MPNVTDILDPRDLQQIASLQVLARQVVEGFTSGLHRSPHKGFSVEFKQHRQYVPGDDLRSLDWKVFGKTDRFYIREYEEETNLRATLLLDASGSMQYGGAGSARIGPGRSGDVSKLHYATRLAACLAYLMLQQSDSVGLVTFDEKIRRYIPPRSRASHLKVLLDEMQQTRPGGESELGRVFHDLAPKIHRRGLIVVLSDCFCNVAELMKAMAQFRHARHDVILFQIWHRDELEFPFKGWTRFDCLEDIGRHHMIDPAHLRQAYLNNLRRFREELEVGCHRHRIDLVPMTTDQPYAEALAVYLAMRRKRA